MAGSTLRCWLCHTPEQLRSGSMERRSALAAAAAALLLVTVAAWAAAARQNAAEATLGFLRTWTGVALPAAGAAPLPLLAQLPLNASAARQRLDTTPNSRPPIVFIPPLGGVQLQTRLSGAAARHFWCPRSTGGAWRLSWLNLATLLPGLFPCWADNFRSLRLGSACSQPTNRSQVAAGDRRRRRTQPSNRAFWPAGWSAMRAGAAGRRRAWRWSRSRALTAPWGWCRGRQVSRGVAASRVAGALAAAALLLLLAVRAFPASPPGGQPLAARKGPLAAHRPASSSAPCPLGSPCSRLLCHIRPAGGCAGAAGLAAGAGHEGAPVRLAVSRGLQARANHAAGSEPLLQQCSSAGCLIAP